MARNIENRIKELEQQTVPASDQNAIVITCSEDEDAEAIEKQAIADNPGRLVLVVQYVSSELVRQQIEE